MHLTAPIVALRRLAARWVHPDAERLERPQYARPALAALGTGIALLLAQSWPLSLFFAPALVVGCRYHELSRYRPVRPSRWTFLMLTLAAAGGGLWVGTHPAGGLEAPLLLALTLASIGTGLHLYAAQRRIAAHEARIELLANPDEDGPNWACGGVLAVLPVLFLLAFVDGIGSWRLPVALLWGLAGLPLLALQLRRSPRLPVLAIAWLAAGIGLELQAALAAAPDLFDDAAMAFGAVALVNGSLICYLRGSARVRQTFAVASSPAGPRLAVATAPPPAGRAPRIRPSQAPVVAGHR